MPWEHAGSTWGARAWDWAMYQEPLCENASDVVLREAGVGPGTRLLDVACGSGLVIQHATALGAQCTGVDASQELLDVARDRAPDAEFLRCDMAQIPLPSESFDVVVSFNGLQFGGPKAVAESARILRPGGVMALVFWQDPGDFAAYFATIAAHSPPPSSGAPAPMAWSVPGVVEDRLLDVGLTVAARGVTRVQCLYRDVNDAYRGLAASGPAAGAIAHSGEDAFHEALSGVIGAHEDRVTGRVLMSGTFGHVIARHAAE